jgi:hypothetical protein
MCLPPVQPSPHGERAASEPCTVLRGDFDDGRGVADGAGRESERRAEGEDCESLRVVWAAAKRQALPVHRKQLKRRIG